MDCRHCGGNVVLASAKGMTRKLEKDGPDVQVAPSVMIMTCEKCGERYIDPDAGRRLDEGARWMLQHRPADAVFPAGEPKAPPKKKLTAQEFMLQSKDRRKAKQAQS